MRHHDTAVAKFQKLRQNHIDLRRVHDILIPDTCQLLDFKRNGHIRIDKSGKTIHDLSAGHLYRTDLNDTIVHWGKSGSLDIKYYIILMQSLPLVIGHDLLQIIHQVCLYSIDNFEKVLLVRILVSGFFSLALFRFPQIVPDMISIRETLHYTVIRDGNSTMSPFIGSLHNIFCL